MPGIKRVAVTGSAGSGKSTVCRYLQGKGIPVIYLDELSREAVIPGSSSLKKIRETFGPKAVTADGNIDRPFLRQVIIDSPDSKKKLEEILHPEIISIMNKKIADAGLRGSAFVIVEVPLLFETGMEKMFDISVLVTSDPDDRINRLSIRDGVSFENAASLVSIQMPDEIKAEKAGYLIHNSGSVANLVEAAEKLYNYLQ